MSAAPDDAAVAASLAQVHDALDEADALAEQLRKVIEKANTQLRAVRTAISQESEP